MNFSATILVIYIAIALFSIIGEKRFGGHYVFIKPLPILVMICGTAFATFKTCSISGSFIVAGLIFGIAGDVLLTRKEMFVQGLVSFLTGHLLYIISFAYQMNSFNLLYLLFMFVTVLYALFFFKNLPAKNKDMTIPVIAYMLVITAMVISSAHTVFAGSFVQLFLIAGALLFYISDSFLAWHVLIRPIRYDSLIVMGTYYSAQLCIGYGTMMSISAG